MPKPAGKVAAVAKGGSGKGGGRGAAAVADPDPLDGAELDAEGNPIVAGDEPELDAEGNPIVAGDEPELDAEGNPIVAGDEPELDAEGNPIVAGDEPDPRDAVIEDLKSRLEAVEKGGAGPKKEEPKAWTEEDWKKMEDDWGLAEKDGIPGTFGRKGLQQFMRAMVGMNQNFREMLNQELGGFKKEAALSDLSREKGYEDARSLRKGIDEFMKDFDPKHHADKVLLKKAVTYARGLVAQGKLKKAVNNRVISRKINAGGAHGKPGGESGASGKAIQLSAEQKLAAKKFKMSEAEYAKYMVTDNLEDIPLPE